MEQKKKTKELRKTFSFQVDEAGKLYNPLKWELPKKTVRVKGLQLTSDFPDRLFYRGDLRVEIGGDELFPEGTASRVLMSGQAVAPRERFFDLGDVGPGDLSIKVRYQDRDHVRAELDGGYQVSLVLLIDEER